MGTNRLLTLSVLAAIAALSVLYFHGLGSPRSYLSVEEVLQLLQAQAVASSGHDLVGRWLPVYPSEPYYLAGRDPLWVYTEALLLRVAGFSETIARTPSAVVGVLDAVLIFLLCRRVFRSTATGLAAAFLLALTPAHFFHSRLATSQIGPVPFILGWLLLLATYLESRASRHLFAAAAVLGIGVYSYLSAVFLTPLLFFAMLVVVRQHASVGNRDGSHLATWRQFRPAVVGFLIAIAPFVIWHLVHRERLVQLFGYYTANGYNADLIRDAPLLTRVTTRVDMWWGAANPSPLFFTGDGNLRFSTGHSGHFLLPTAALALIGLMTLRHGPVSRLRVLLVTGLLAAPLPAVLATNLEIKRWLAFVPFVIVLAAAGVQVLLERKTPGRQLLLGVLLAASALQFAGYLHDYWTGYRERSTFYYGGNVGGAVREALAGVADTRCILVDRRVPALDHWLLYTRISGRDVAAQQLNVVDAEVPIAVPAGCPRTAVLLHEELATGPAGIGQRLTAAGWTKTPVPEAGGRTFLTLFWYHRPP